MNTVDLAKAAKWHADAQSRLAELVTIRNYVADQLDDAERCLFDEQRRVDRRLALFAAHGWTPQGVQP